MWNTSSAVEARAVMRRRAALCGAAGAAATLLALAADPYLLLFVGGLRTQGGRQVMLVLTELGNGWVDFGLAAAVLVAGWALARSHLVDAGLRGAVAVAAAGLAALAVKHLACRARPGVPTAGDFFHHVPCLGADWGFFSFPSGHAATATALAVALGLRVPALRLPAAAAAGVVLVSRVYLGAHFPSDVLAGATLGAVAAILATARRPRPAPEPSSPF